MGQSGPEGGPVRLAYYRRSDSGDSAEKKQEGVGGGGGGGGGGGRGGGGGGGLGKGKREREGESERTIHSSSRPLPFSRFSISSALHYLNTLTGQ